MKNKKMVYFKLRLNSSLMIYSFGHEIDFNDFNS